ncbi:MAG: dTMP kinase [Trueperaceae bacterium]
MAGLFIAFEGPEGGGKSTQIAALDARLRASGVDPVVTREPGGTGAGDAIRRVVLDPALEVAPLTEFLLYSASRAQLVSEILTPALAAGRVVVSDRFSGASLAYQGYGRRLELDFIEELTQRATGGLRPDLTVLLDLEPEQGLERISTRGDSDRLELADLEFHRRVRRGFLNQATGREDWLVLDATLLEEDLAKAIWQRVSPLLPAGARSSEKRPSS